MSTKFPIVVPNCIDIKNCTIKDTNTVLSIRFYTFEYEIYALIVKLPLDIHKYIFEFIKYDYIINYLYKTHITSPKFREVYFNNKELSMDFCYSFKDMTDNKITELHYKTEPIELITFFSGSNFDNLIPMFNKYIQIFGNLCYEHHHSYIYYIAESEECVYKNNEFIFRLIENDDNNSDDSDDYIENYGVTLFTIRHHRKLKIAIEITKIILDTVNYLSSKDTS